MLWKKDRKHPALYTKIFSAKLAKIYSDIMPILENDSMISKNEEISIKNRRIGNKLFAEKKWSAAMEKYNDSIRFAEVESKNVTLAFANRSTCFFKMGLYFECLIDIQLAVDTGYPKHLMPKLIQRQNDCLKPLDGRAKPLRFKLSYDRNQEYPCMANVVQIKRGIDGKYVAFATEDIDVGQTIVVEKAFTCTLYTKLGSKCNICLKGNTNLVPCPKCPEAMFCGKECQEHFLHDYECGFPLMNDELLDGPIKGVMRTIFMAIDMLPTIDELMAFVEQTIKSDPNELPGTLVDEKSKYQAFLKLPLTAPPKDMLFAAFGIYKKLIKHPKIEQQIQTEKHRRFFMHLVLIHGLRPENQKIIQPKAFSQILFQEQNVLYSQIGLIKMCFEHSCTPNVFIDHIDGHYVYTTIRPVKNGEQLVHGIMYTLLEKKEKRQQILLNNEKIACKCGRCEGIGDSLEQRDELASDPLFLNIMSSGPVDSQGKSKLEKSAENCVAFLKKYHNIKWCYEIAKVVMFYAHILQKRLNANELNE